ncbi:MAG: (2Fe-2S)-binding protein [Firmicutes bacterium]|nr:(2Fe-2S)-binding protein [Bacillota bacterium]
MKRRITFILNGEKMDIEVSPGQMLISLIKDDLHLHGTKKGCARGECGACTVIIDGKAVNSCLIPALKVQGSIVETIEGLSTPTRLHPLQQSFIENGAVQCGYCIPGTIMSAKALLDKKPCPTVAEVKMGIAGNICRCTGYVKIEKAILEAAQIISNSI